MLGGVFVYESRSHIALWWCCLHLAISHYAYLKELTDMYSKFS